MKTVLVAVFTLTLSCITHAQQLDEATRLMLLSKYEDAKKEIDKVLADPKTKESPEAYLLKANIYGEIFFDSLLRAKYPNAGDQAYNALTQYAGKDPSLKLFRAGNGMRPLSILYSVRFNEGRKLFSQSKWDEALKNFAVAEDLGDFIAKNGLGTSRQNIDTFAVIYAGYAAQNARNTERALYYYRKFAAEKIGGQEFIEVYRYLLNAAMSEKNADAFAKYLALVRTLYPAEKVLWNAYEFEYTSKTDGLVQMLGKYKTADKAGNLSATEYVSYAEYFAGVPAEELNKLASADRFGIKTMAAEAFGKAFTLEKKGLYAFNAGVLLYQQYSTLEDQLTAAGGADAQSRRKTIVEQQRPMVDKSVQWLEKAYQILKSKAGRDQVETSALSRSVDLLANLYLWKRDNVADKNAPAYKEFDAKYRQFDAEHGIYN